MSDEFRLVADAIGLRLDVFLHRRLPHLSRARIQALVRAGLVTVNGLAPKSAYRVRQGDVIRGRAPPPEPAALAPEPIPLEVIFQDTDVLVVDKPAGLTVHPAPGHPSHTLVNALLAHCPDLQGVGDPDTSGRPGIVHRLDKETSGLMVVAKTEGAYHHLVSQWKEHRVRKAYLALVRGRLPTQEGVIDAPVGRNPSNRKKMAVVAAGKPAVTRYRVVRAVGEHTLVELFPETGRTHQIRVHLAHIGHPLVGDKVYGRGGPSLGRHFLHAYRLGFVLPATGRYREFTSKLPQELAQVLKELE